MKKINILIFTILFIFSLASVTGAASLGDVNEDGSINSLDISILNSYLLGNETSISISATDVDNSGDVNSTDFSLLINYINGGINNFPGSSEVDYITATPVTPDASKETKALLNYLHTVYGEKILSGQMESTWEGGPDHELDYVEQHSGKLPAIRGLDFIHEDDNQNVVERAKDWWEMGGIPSIMWHWGAPTVGEGYEASKETIDVEAALTSGTEEHVAMMDDLDRIANYLEDLQEANVPVLWRPFHEFDGEWFWWGKDGPDLFIELWQYMFDYFVEDRELDNLIWVLCYSNKVDEDWYPGDDYVDIGGADIYDVGSEPLSDLFNSTRKIVGHNMPVSYHECGVMPDPELSEEENVHWSWFMTWHTDWLTEENSQEHIDYVYNHDYVVTLDELPDIMDYAEDGNPTVARVTTMSNGRGEISREPEETIIDKGTDVTFTAKPETGWEFTGWDGPQSSTTNPLELNVDENICLTANFEPETGTNLLPNGNFSDGLAHWSEYLFEEEGAVADINVEDNECIIDITGGGNELYHVQLIHPSITLEEGTEYELSFSAYADSSRDIFVKIGEDGGDYLEYFGEEYTIGTSPETYSTNFTMDEETDENARMEFNVGLETSNVYIQEVTLSIVE
ncbi:MAG: glycosyl hydrolase [Halanaerobiaceae bacterium]